MYKILKYKTCHQVNINNEIQKKLIKKGVGIVLELLKYSFITIFKYSNCSVYLLTITRQTNDSIKIKYL